MLITYEVIRLYNLISQNRTKELADGWCDFRMFLYLAASQGWNKSTWSLPPTFENKTIQYEEFCSQMDKIPQMHIFLAAIEFEER